ncbi:MAG: hypothetical protein M1326_07045 [Cyanobacteria bacterium]|nr:hypothetical protein [Cyanobacteriota bacterium]
MPRAKSKDFYELNKNIKLNKIKNIRSLKAAARSRKTKLKLFEPEDQTGYASGISTLLPKYMEKKVLIIIAIFMLIQ